ncbi:hypothetical protein CONPUDRAFT_148196 [Coniophora puteana RWD-64-598 SS2]|uniref:Uncharacterized protein n=1 Tax=Coniophora puteana (strain RWD-64-598) TaxID=741705 RepID=A0A5M3N3U7_CONPW|nr:uncharacterized protein CONPUDRAFT_148196 [Coniophora puteana RWD-64-598 SS2]EIW86080.1 hypothetical protein CONPUDRAFT_148196 [Coniophora puteana RWD-64-598 SS2]
MVPELALCSSPSFPPLLLPLPIFAPWVFAVARLDYRAGFSRSSQLHLTFAKSTLPPSNSTPNLLVIFSLVASDAGFAGTHGLMFSHASLTATEPLLLRCPPARVNWQAASSKLTPSIEIATCKHVFDHGQVRLSTLAAPSFPRSPCATH